MPQRHKSKDVEQARNEGRQTRREDFKERNRALRNQQQIQARGGEDEMMRVVFLGEHKEEQRRLAQEAEQVALTADHIP